jgi:hypothetical protein
MTLASPGRYAVAAGLRHEIAAINAEYNNAVPGAVYE